MTDAHLHLVVNHFPIIGTIFGFGILLAGIVLKNNTVLSNLVARQAIHEQYGGVVPELASRAHQANIVPVVEMA
jgi:hypothetical protein